ncbi:hypothetical protein PR202_ga23487 [Eleusine coracana subsp. coracana]|uniref:Factor of DNA methylation 1-5/IDN2 domain-containing protein n=1 Tax=Eleusine coracana subsp. coracana TaxID=191504 RepID=A0AAV5D6B2_ELECO|nr:hypothetical protein PR202_ga23487 [Eleusine coracana subsp. coracana]
MSSSRNPAAVMDPISEGNEMADGLDGANPAVAVDGGDSSSMLVDELVDEKSGAKNVDDEKLKQLEKEVAKLDADILGKIENLKEQLGLGDESFSDELNSVAMTKYIEATTELKDARKELIKVFQEMPILRFNASIGIKRMGEMNMKPFKEACQRLYGNDAGEEWMIRSVKLIIDWQEQVKKPSWHPFKTVEVDGVMKLGSYNPIRRHRLLSIANCALAPHGPVPPSATTQSSYAPLPLIALCQLTSVDKHGNSLAATTQSVVDDDNPKLAGLRAEYGDAVCNAVKVAVAEMNDYNPSGGYVTQELLNFGEGRKATMAEALREVCRQSQKRRKRDRTNSLHGC